ncbi:MAG TPA: GNAT family N-acetyltransferase [Aliidongia sp.]|nr:GNAT family N-acetyltransferase [Aliidongia sp.]
MTKPNQALFVGAKIRKLFAFEREKVCNHLLRLEPENLRLRFFGTVGESYIASYSETIFSTGGIILGYFENGKLCAIGELRRQGARWSQAAELAITVEREFQHRGIGTEMLRRLVEIACNRSIKILHLACLIDNTRMQKIARKLGGALRYVDGAAEVDISPPWPSCWSLLGEAAADGQAALHAWWTVPGFASIGTAAERAAA